LTLLFHRVLSGSGNQAQIGFVLIYLFLDLVYGETRKLNFIQYITDELGNLMRGSQDGRQKKDFDK
jgi:hypothetical protein